MPVGDAGSFGKSLGQRKLLHPPARLTMLRRSCIVLSNQGEPTEVLPLCLRKNCVSSKTTKMSWWRNIVGRIVLNYQDPVGRHWGAPLFGVRAPGGLLRLGAPDGRAQRNYFRRTRALWTIAPPDIGTEVPDCIPIRS